LAGGEGEDEQDSGETESAHDGRASYRARGGKSMAGWEQDRLEAPRRELGGDLSYTNGPSNSNQLGRTRK
jgi:hypothetical protein